jgi:trans-aconitate methyltransferase
LIGPFLNSRDKIKRVDAEVREELDVSKESGNEQQGEFWNGPAGSKWVANFEENERHTSPFGNLALDVASTTPGERVLDVGCGCGATTLALGAAVGTSGQVLGIDLSTTMLARAQEMKTSSKLTNIDFRRADAQTSNLDRRKYDLVFSRFGVMFFANAVAAFANLRSALQASGRLVFVCWQAPSENPWMSVPNRAALKFFELEPPPHDAPGPFSLASPQRIRAILSDAGFSDVEITSEIRTLRVGVGQSIDHWVHERLLMGFAGQLYESSTSTVQARARRALAESVEPFRIADGLELEGAAWIVRASHMS